MPGRVGFRGCRNSQPRVSISRSPQAANNAGIDREDIYEVVVAGNTIMTHILLGIDPAYMIEEPYVPVVRRYLTTAAIRAGLE